MVLNDCHSLVRRKKGQAGSAEADLLTKTASVGKADIILLWLYGHGRRPDCLLKGKPPPRARPSPVPRDAERHWDVNLVLCIGSSFSRP